MRKNYFWRVLAYCLMGNHYHLLAQTPEPNLAKAMHQLNGVYAQSFNRRHDRVGHLLEGRYRARLVQADEHLFAATRYIVRNPIQAGFCGHPSEWRWSSHRAALGLEPPRFLDVSALLSYYAATREVARQHYRVCVEEEDSERLSAPPVDGDEVVRAAALELMRAAPGIPSRYLRPSVSALPALLASSDSDAAIARAAECGYSLREIARHLGVNASTVSRRLKRRRTATNGA